MALYVSTFAAPDIVKQVREIREEDGAWHVWFVEPNSQVSITVCETKAEAWNWAVTVDPFFGLA